MYYRKYVGERIYFSPINKEDYQLYTKWLNDEKISRGTNQVHKIITEDFEKEWISHAYEKGRYQFAVVNKSNDEPIGIYGLELKNDMSKQYFFVGFIGEDDYRGIGVGTEALKLLTNFAFDILNAHTLYTTIYSYNISSLKSVVKAGYKKCGILREAIYYGNCYYDEYIFEMTRDEYFKLYDK